MAAVENVNAVAAGILCDAAPLEMATGFDSSELEVLGDDVRALLGLDDVAATAVGAARWVGVVADPDDPRVVAADGAADAVGRTLVASAALAGVAAVVDGASLIVVLALTSGVVVDVPVFVWATTVLTGAAELVDDDGDGEVGGAVDGAVGESPSTAAALGTEPVAAGLDGDSAPALGPAFAVDPASEATEDVSVGCADAIPGPVATAAASAAAKATAVKPNTRASSAMKYSRVVSGNRRARHSARQAFQFRS